MHFRGAQGEEYEKVAVVAEHSIDDILLHKLWNYSKLPVAVRSVHKFTENFSTILQQTAPSVIRAQFHPEQLNPEFILVISKNFLDLKHELN